MCSRNGLFFIYCKWMGDTSGIESDSKPNRGNGSEPAIFRFGVQTDSNRFVASSNRFIVCYLLQMNGWHECDRIRFEPIRGQPRPNSIQFWKHFRRPLAVKTKSPEQNIDHLLSVHRNERTDWDSFTMTRSSYLLVCPLKRKQQNNCESLAADDQIWFSDWFLFQNRLSCPEALSLREVNHTPRTRTKNTS